MSGVAIRPATPGDAAVLGAILSDWIDATPWMPRLHTRDEDRRFVAGMIGAGRVHLAETAGPVGFVALSAAGQDADGGQGAAIREIDALYVAAGARGRGIGRALVAVAQDGAGRVELWTFRANTCARGFYAGLGFAEIGRTDGEANAERLPDLRLAWERAA